ncbi:helix-turn-helix transcriptional regulator [Kitasatospora sp. NBC_01266]|uniref:helix-turn-helix transcriptional regulator n=1 Tax=Kitasatospora sp. NBC_01266 TaxID=2903572 RepID=UPI002E3695B7|nr:helix-turn-helix transcriptional regulator [Kitasatospora sp. NBC_01266]
MSEAAPEPIGARQIGSVIRRARVIADRSQHDVASKLGYHQSKLSRLEKGIGTDDVRVLRAVAAELDIPLESLGLTTSPRSADLRTDDMQRQGFLAAGVAALAVPARPHTAGLDLVQALLPTAAMLPDRQPLTEAALRHGLSKARRLLYSCRYTELETLLPTLLTDLRRTQHETPGSLTLTSLAATAYQTTVSMLIKLGDNGNAWLAVGRAMSEAERSGNPIVLASSVRVQTHLMAREHHHAPAVTMVQHTADQLGGHYDQREPGDLAAFGLMLLRGVTAASTGGDRSTTAELLDQADEVAQYVDRDHPDAWANFSQTNVALHRTSAAVALGDAGAAIDTARPLLHRRIPAPERQAALWVDLARAFNQQGKLSEGYRALRIAERHAAEDIRRRPDIRELVADMAARDRRGALPELRQFSRELGVRP